MESKNRIYNTDFRKKLKSKLEKISNKNDLIIIYNIIVSDIGTNISSNKNGIFINMNILSDDCIIKLNNFIDEKITITNNNENEKQNFKVYKFDDVEIMSELGHKLSNHEKNIIKRIRNKN
jgi:hypothetical protein